MMHIYAERGGWRVSRKLARLSSHLRQVHAEAAQFARDRHQQIPGGLQLVEILLAETVLAIVERCTLATSVEERLGQHGFRRHSHHGPPSIWGMKPGVWTRRAERVNTNCVKLAPWAVPPTSSSSARGSSDARWHTSSHGGAHPCRSSTTAPPAWARRRPRPACWRPTLKRRKAARCSISPSAVSSFSTAWWRACPARAA